ncbi:LuxR family transcriptional regulator (plasmid) [Roseovarius faecimaris]|uniref:LuxR family transcriptional regulator n=2 Tax=Roseovarius faecimaris TaxID=2494550 RepID=A0A6I6ILS6_9RHOB|nr:LuxR family transcriptional regulator [Roseovarius faecimaris]
MAILAWIQKELCHAAHCASIPLKRGVQAMSLMDVAAELEQVETLDALWPRIVAALRDEGFDFVIYLTVDADFGAPVLMTTHPEIHDGGDLAGDPFLEYCCHSYAPTLTGAAFLPRYDYLPEAARAFILRAEQLGFTAGLAIPVRLQGSSRFGGFNIGTGLDAETFEARYGDGMSRLRTFCLLMHRRLEELQGSAPIFEQGFRRLMVSSPGADSGEELPELTPREREVLFLLAGGLSRKECAASCGISPHTVSDHTKSIYRKLDVRNLVEAARLTKLI